MFFKGCAKEIGRLRKEGASKPNNRGSSRPPPPVERAQKRNSDLAVVQEGRKWVANEDTSAALRESDDRESSMDESIDSDAVGENAFTECSDDKSADADTPKGVGEG